LHLPNELLKQNIKKLCNIFKKAVDTIYNKRLKPELLQEESTEILQQFKLNENT